MIGRRSATAVCWFFVVRANSEKSPKCGLGARWATAKQHLGTGLRNTPSSHPVLPRWLLWLYRDLFESYFNAAICSSDNPVYLEINFMSISSFNIAPAMSSCFFVLPSSIPFSRPSFLPFSIPSSNPSSRPSSRPSLNPLSFAKAIWFRMSRSVVMSFRYLILSSGAKLCKSAEENNRSKISPSNPAGLPCYDCCLPVFYCAGKQQKGPEMRFGRTVGDGQTAPRDGAPK